MNDAREVQGHRDDEPGAAPGHAGRAAGGTPPTTSTAGTWWLGIELRSIQADAQEHSPLAHSVEPGDEGVGVDGWDLQSVWTAR